MIDLGRGARRLHRQVLASCAALALLVGCGSVDGSGSGTGTAGESGPLSAEQVAAALPDAKAAPGWEVTSEPVAYPQKKARELRVARCYEGPDECSKPQVTGVSALAGGRGKPRLDFVLIAYEDAESARASYEPVWKAWRGRSVKPRELDLGKIGDENDAVSGVHPSLQDGAGAATAQVRVGSVIMVTVGEAGPGIELPGTLEKFTAVFAERAEQAQDGKTPSAALDDAA
ncbi:hypothetical protein [Streptomyces sp. NPDC013187]|uniref:hypothetical protein n=1 Tax=Streptomyces sp. NPDC013187 TaxID=3364865 RepID=UPI0036800899